jgi:hypothetical protein
MQCPSCNKFAALEMQEPEVNELSLDAESGVITADVRIVRNSECCGDEMKEYSFNTEVEIPTELATKINEIAEKAKQAGTEADFDVEEGGIDQLEEGGGRYKKSYYGFTLTAIIKHGETTLGEVEVTDKCAASEMEELN